jgi:hypothetical protein
MASDDFYTHIARQRLQQINAGRAQALADLEACKASADYEGAAQSVQALADLEAAKQNLVALHESYVASQTPPEAPEMTPEEQAAKPWNRMNWQDGLAVSRGSKYGADLDASDPNVQAGFREIQRRRARGE